jgi:hypothetical protein
MDAGLVKGEGFAVDASIIKADASRQRGVPGDEPVNWSDPALSTRAVREYLEALDEESLAETLPKRLSLTDPQARWTAAPGGPAFYAYSTNYLIDTEHGVIMDVEPTPAIFRSRQTDCAACPMKAKCCPNTAFRKIARSVHEAARDVARRIAATAQYVRSRHERKKVEMLFDHLKRILKLDRLRLRA